MFDCLEGRQFAGQTLKRPRRNSGHWALPSSKGEYFKGALLAPKYPPKGSQAVGLIWMTDEFRSGTSR